MDSDRDNHINTFVRTENKEILIKDKDKWKPFEVRGIDMGSGIPGEWSTDYAITKETYLHWFQLIQEAGANTLRVYSVQNPSFYKAFYEYNSQHEEPLYLLQGIWVNDYIQNSRVDAYADSFAGKLLDNCLVTVDVIHGKRLIINNDADTSTGLYLHDVSKWVLGYIIGNGWEDTTVAYTDEKYPDMEPYKTIFGALQKSGKVLLDASRADNHESRQAIVRPWLQDFTATYLGDGNYITYGATEVAEEVRAVQDAGYEEWMLWSAANKYHLEGLSVDGSSAAAAEVSTETSEEGETAAEDADGTSEAESAAETAQQ